MERTPEFGMNVESIVVMRRHQIMRVLCKYPRVTVGEVGRKTGLSKTYCWNLLEGMIYRGLVTSVKGGKHRGVDTRVFMTAYDALREGEQVLELGESEVALMRMAHAQGTKAAEWYGYASGDTLTVTQELLF